MPTIRTTKADGVTVGRPHVPPCRLPVFGDDTGRVPLTAVTLRAYTDLTKENPDA
jgi:hypothetical protein